MTPAQLAGALRLGNGTDDPAEPVAGVLNRMSGAGTAIINVICPDAPDEAKDAALVQIVGYWYDKDVTIGGRLENALVNSGARAILDPWCPREAVVIDNA